MESMILATIVPAFYMLVKGSWSIAKWLRQIAEEYEFVEVPEDGIILYCFYLIFVNEKLSFSDKLEGLGKFSPVLVGIIVISLLSPLSP